MQITFDPLNPDERAAALEICAALYDADNTPTSRHRFPLQSAKETAGPIDGLGGVVTTPVAATLHPADRPDVGAPAPSAVPLPPAAAPLPAAATLFSTAPEAPQDGQAATTPVPPPPVPTAPVPAVPPAPAPAAPRAENGELDKDGLPWDARIHSGSKERNKDNTWRQRRNLAEGVRETVEQELRALMLLSTRPNVTTGGDDPLDRAAVVPPVPTAGGLGNSSSAMDAATASAPIATAPAGPSEGNVPPPPVPAPPTSAPATAPIPTPPAPPAPTAAAPSAPVTFAELMRMCMKGVTERTFTEASVHEILGRHGLAAGEMGRLASADMNETMQKVATDVRALLGDA